MRRVLSVLTLICSISTLVIAQSQAAGFDGTKLFFEDLFRAAPFDTATTVPDASMQAAVMIKETKAQALLGLTRRRWHCPRDT